jgi:hypothetical protein
MSDLGKKASDPEISEKSGAQYPISSTTVTKRPWWKLGGKDLSFAPVDADSVAPSSSGSVNEDTEAGAANNIHGGVFDDSRAAEFYKPIEKYEGKHRFDPHATWTAEEERKLVRSVRNFNPAIK